MRKVLIAFDGSHFSEGAFEFARKLSKTEPILLTGIFLPQVEYGNLWSYSVGMNTPILTPLAEEEEDVTTKSKKAVQLFTEACKNNNIDFRIHKCFYDFTLPELKKQSSFADLLIIVVRNSMKIWEQTN